MQSRALIALVIALWVQCAHARNCATPVTDEDVVQCELTALEAEDKKLNAVYRAVLSSQTQDDMNEFHKDLAAQAVEDIKKAQRAWIVFRDADCEAVYGINAAGTIRRYEHVSCLRYHTRTRIEQLQKLQDAGAYH